MVVIKVLFKKLILDLLLPCVDVCHLILQFSSSVFLVNLRLKSTLIFKCLFFELHFLYLHPRYVFASVLEYLVDSIVQFDCILVNPVSVC